jgi:predicted amidohydrolase
VRAAAIQLNSTADRAANLAGADRLIRGAAADGAKLIVLPEKWSAIGSAQDLRAGAEQLSGTWSDSGGLVDGQGGVSEDRPGSDRSSGGRGGSGEGSGGPSRDRGESSGDRGGSADGPAIAWARELARELEIDLVAGSIAERVPGREKLANTSVHVDPRGEIKAVYRKVHMFDVEIDGKAYRESDVEEPGTEIVLSQTADGVELGLSICYDLRFPELFRILAVRGARVIALPAAFTLPTTRDHWETLVKARAIENQAFVIAANQIGPHPGGMRSGGRSMIVDPWGVVLAQAPDREGYVVAELDLARQLDIRAQLPALANRRPAAYRWPGPGEGSGDGGVLATATHAHALASEPADDAGIGATLAQTTSRAHEPACGEGETP